MWWMEGRNAVIDAQVPNGYYYSLQTCHQPPTACFLTQTKDSTFDWKKRQVLSVHTRLKIKRLSLFVKSMVDIGSADTTYLTLNQTQS
jgi:hypothetical protein